MFGGTNITGVQFIDASSDYVQEVIRFWNQHGKAVEISADNLRVSVFVVLSALWQKGYNWSW